MFKPMLSLVITVLLLALGYFSAHAATFYVSTAGANSVTCAQAQNVQTPRRTINSGIACLAGGDTLIVSGGTYNECLNDYGPTPVPAGTSWATATTIKVASGETVWLKAPTGCPGGGGIIEVDLTGSQYIIFDGFKIDAQIDASTINSFGIGIASNYIRLQNMEVMHARTGVKLEGQHNELIKMDIHHSGVPVCVSPTGCHGVYVSGWYNLIDHIKSHDNNCFGVTLSVEGGAVQYNTVQFSDFYNNGCGGILAYSSNYVYANIIWNNNNGIQLGDNSEAYHNVLYNNGDWGLWPAGSGQKFKNNISLGHRWDILNQNTGTVDFASNICTAVGVPYTIGCTIAASVATLFQNASANNFYHRAGSPAIGAGVPLSGPALSIDKDGIPRPSTGPVDVGAYQYVPQGPVIPAPQQLRIVIR